jgi:hypothetical protein
MKIFDLELLGTVTRWLESENHKQEFVEAATRVSDCAMPNFYKCSFAVLWLAPTPRLPQPCHAILKGFVHHPSTKVKVLRKSRPQDERRTGLA